MSSDNPGKLFEGRLFKISTLAALLVLLGISGMLAYQNWRLLQELASAKQPVAEPQPPAIVTPPVSEPASLPVKKPAPAVAGRPSTPKPAPANYTQPEQNLAPPVTVVTHPAPAPVARVVPTDVISAEPIPFPPTEPAMPSEPRSLVATLPAGSVLTVRLLDTLNTDRNQAGDRFQASLEEPIVLDGTVVASRGTIVEGRIVDSQKAGRVKGVAEMTLELTQLRIPDGEVILLESNAIRREGETSTGKDAAKVGAGAAIGAVIGAIGGGGKGAAVGAASGAGAGTAGVLLTRGEPLILSQETVLSFQLNAPVDITYAPGEYWDGSSRAGDWDRERPILRRRR
jgi:hypothetical protein